MSNFWGALQMSILFFMSVNIQKNITRYKYYKII